MPKQRELIVSFIGERRHFENGESRVVIADVQDEDGTILTVKGEAAEGQLVRGLTYRFYGHVFDHHTYGKQFHFQNFIVEEPASGQSILAYLKQCTGIGPATAQKLWDNFGTDAVKKLREDPISACKGIPKFSLETATAAAEFLTKNQAIERVKIDVLGLLNGRGFPKKTVELAIQKFGAKAAEKIRHNPYLLMAFRGCGFLSTDKMYLDLGLSPDRLKRQALCAWYSISSDSNGHTWFPRGQAQSFIKRSISGSRLNEKRAIELMVRHGGLTVRQSGMMEWVAETQKAQAEDTIAICIEDSWSENSQWPWMLPADENESGISTHQARRLANATAGTIGVLSGSPGTGKTYVSAELLKACIDRFGLNAVAACAPTGKAAVRLTEALNQNGVPLQAITIHRLLQVESSDDEGWRFVYGPHNLLPYKIVLIDESSMIDASIMALLLSARSADSHFLFVGDPNQLPPVGHGAPLRDLIRAGVPHGELREIRRNSGRIVQACAEIRDKQTFQPSPQPDPENGENLILLEESKPEAQIEQLEQCLIRERAAGKFDPIWDVQVIVAVNKKSPLGRKQLNERLQGLLNPHGETKGKNQFRVDDKIVNTKNGWFPSVEPSHPEANDEGKVFVANGEQAEAIQVEPNRTIARLWSPDRTIVIPQGQRKESDSEEDAGSGSSWELGYAQTVHKSQGSSWPIVIVMLDSSGAGNRVTSRQSIYTAISRAEYCCKLIGDLSTALLACKRDALEKRKTFLVEKIQELRPQPAAEPEPGEIEYEVYSVRCDSEPVSLTESELDEIFAGIKE